MTNKNYKGVIIKESLENQEILRKLKVIDTKIETVTEKHKTPWIQQWTMYTVEIPENEIENIAEELTKSLDSKHDWYADFKNNSTHYIIFYKKIFKVNRRKKEEYANISKYGISLGIPDYQVDFSNLVINI